MARDERSGMRRPAELSGTGMRLGIVCSRFNDRITERLLHGTWTRLREMGVSDDDVTVRWVPGAFEVPLAAKALAGSGSVDAVVTLGAVIRGETGHYDFVAGECARGVQQVQLETGVPVAFGVLTTDDLDQALARSGDDGNKGREAAEVAVEMVDLIRDLAART